MKKFLQNVSCASPTIFKKEEFSKNKEGNIKTLTNSQRAKNSDIYSKKDILIVILLIVGSNLRNSVTEQENCELDDTHK